MSYSNNAERESTLLLHGGCNQRRTASRWTLLRMDILSVMTPGIYNCAKQDGVNAQIVFHYILCQFMCV